MNISRHTNLLGLDRTDMEKLLESLGIQPSRANDLLRNLYRFGVTEPLNMHGLSGQARDTLAACTTVTLPKIVTTTQSTDGSIKWAMQGIENTGRFETVYIPEQNRATLCISTQVGCPIGCPFCATGRLPTVRNLTAADIIGQVWRAAENIGFTKNGNIRPFSNVVLMGMGEPLLNLEGVLPSINLLLDDHTFGLSRRRVTLSTTGVVPGINRLSEACTVNLALSLHAPDNALRNDLVPLNRQYAIEDVLAAVRHYLERSHSGRVTIEYIMLKDVNDSPEQAKAVAVLLANTPSKINLIPHNPFPASPFHPSTEESIIAFSQVLLKAGYPVMRRIPRGLDIAAACGQLANHTLPKKPGN